VYLFTIGYKPVKHVRNHNSTKRCFKDAQSLYCLFELFCQISTFLCVYFSNNIDDRTVSIRSILAILSVWGLCWDCLWYLFITTLICQGQPTQVTATQRM